jgi:CHAT domain-containing protein
VKPGQKLEWKFLTGTAPEAGGVVGAAEKQKIAVTRLEGEKATPAVVLAALPKAKFAHLATHGFFADPSFRTRIDFDESAFEIRFGQRVGRVVNSPLLMTGLVFAGANNPKTVGRGIVTGEQLIDLDLSGLELAVLSACETGVGDVPRDEGPYGLQRAFHYAGARNVVVSLWKVPDQSTAALMARLYAHLWNDKNPVAPLEALRQAQLEIYKNPGKVPEWAKGFRAGFEIVGGSEDGIEVKPTKDGKTHPLFWAAFTLSGPGK